MQFEFSTLEKTAVKDLTDVMNEAFAEYFIKVELTEDKMREKFVFENICLDRSVGAFADGRLIGFILNALDDKENPQIAYNAGTGVLKEFRGRRLTDRMYEFILPKLKRDGVVSAGLEVVTENHPAIRVYEKIGFRKVHEFVCLKGRSEIPKTNKTVELAPLDNIDGRFRNFRPSWQNSDAALARMKDRLQTVGAFERDKLVGYIVFSLRGNIKQFAVKQDVRRRGIGQTLFAFAQSKIQDKEMTVINVDKNDHETVSFLGKIGLNSFLEQFEMIMTISR